MPRDLLLSDWLDILDSEYLSTFIKDGGASIKFAVCPEDLKPRLLEGLSGLSSQLGYLPVHLDAVTTKAHMPQDIFFGIAKKVDWRLLARLLILRLAKNKGYNVDDVDAHASGNIFAAIGDAHEPDRVTWDVVSQELRGPLATNVIHNTQMSRDFRVAMFSLCLSETNQEYGGQATEGLQSSQLIDWLTGTKQMSRDLKHLNIFNSITRTNARHLLGSALFWIRFVGYAGTVITLDNTRVTLARNPKDGSRFYNRAMVVDHYELLREFVDGTDRLHGTLMVVVTNNDFLDQESNSRGFGIYEALKTRVMEDVQDTKLVNPIASLIRLA